MRLGIDALGLFVLLAFFAKQWRQDLWFILFLNKILA